jgi:hypothetical protein
MINVSGIICRENQNTYFDQYPFSKNCAVYNITLKKHGSARQATDNKITWRMRLACWIPKAKNTHSQYVTLIAFPWQQWLRERVSILYIPCLSCCFFWQLAGYCPKTEQYRLLPSYNQLIIPNYSPNSVDVPLLLLLTHFKTSFKSTKIKETITVLLNRCWGIKYKTVQK